MPDFHALRGGGARLVLDELETSLLEGLAAEMRALLSGKRPKNDPVIDRLFPSAYEEPEDETAYREMTGDDLTRHKLEALETVSASLAPGRSEIDLTGEVFDKWLACLTDLRLAIGMRVGVDEERMGAEIDPNDPEAQSLTVLHWLGWLQEGLLRAALP